MLLSVAMKNEREMNDLLMSTIPTQNMVAFTVTKWSQKKIYDKIHTEKNMINFGTSGNMVKSTEGRGNTIYQELKQHGVDIFATNHALKVDQTLNKN